MEKRRSKLSHPSSCSKEMIVRGGPLNRDGEVTNLPADLHPHTHTHARTTLTCTRSKEPTGRFLLWECETSPSYSPVPGGNGTEHLANQLQLSPAGLKVSPPTGMIYSQVESENKSLSVPLLLRLRWVRLGGAAWEKGVQNTD